MTITFIGQHNAAYRSARAFLSCGIASLALITGQAYAADAAPDAAAEAEGEAIVVTGTRPIAESEAAALNIQRNSDSLVAVAASDAVGRLPDQNIAQAAGRLPGVAVQRDQGQARYISLRGAPINWTTLSIDGIAIVSPEGRDTRYDSIPSAIASQIVVRKAVTPDMTGETVAGNVDVITRSAFDYSGFHVAGKLGGGYVELGKHKEYEGQAVISNRWNTGIGEIGLLASGSYYKRNMITDNFETDWEQVPQDNQPGNADRVWARETENKLYRLTRKNYSYSGRLDWKPSEGNRIFVQSIFTAFTDDEARDNYIFDLDDRQSADPARAPGCTIATNTNPNNSGYANVCIGNTPLKGINYGVDINQRATLRAFEQSIFTNTLGGDHEFGEGWKLNWRLNYTRAKDDRSVVGEARYESIATRNTRPTVAYDFTNPQLAVVNLFRTIGGNSGPFSAGAPITNIDDFSRPLTTLTSLKAVDITKAYTGKFGLSRELPLLGGEGTITIGGQFDQRTKEANESLLTISNAQAASLGIATTFLPNALTDKSFMGEIPLGYTFKYFDIDKMRANVKLADTIADYLYQPGNFYNVREQVYAAYAMARVKYDWGSVLAGARVEHIKNRGRAFVNLTTPIEVENDITMVYPSLHINYDVAADKKLRLSFNSGAARPDYDQLRPNFTYNDANQTISGGNPDAKPERAFGVDAYFEWYTQPQGYLMVGAFFKKVKDVLFDTTRTFASNELNYGNVDRSQFQYSTIGNGGDGYIYGVEAAIQQQLEPYTQVLGLPGWVGGFGVSANITFNKSEATTPTGAKVSLPGTSDVVYNIGGYYEKYGLSLRLNYQRRSAWLDGLGAPVDGGNQYWAADDEMDLSVRYAITPNFEVYADASNLLNQPGRRYVQDPKYTIEWERFGRRYTGGVRFNF